MQELLNYQYLAREKQVTAISEDTKRDLLEEVRAQGESYQAFIILLMTPPILLPSAISHLAGSEEAFFKMIHPAVEIAAKRAFTLQILLELSQFCGREERKSQEILLDLNTYLIAVPFKFAYRNHPDLLEEAAAMGKEMGTKKLLAVLEYIPPLMRYRRDLMEEKFVLTPSLGGGRIGYLDTKVPGVNLKLWYPKDESLPKLSLTVQELKAVEY